MPDGPAIGARVTDVRHFQSELTRKVTRPLYTVLRARLKAAAYTWQSAFDELANIRHDLERLGEAGDDVARQALLRQQAWHKARFTAGMRRHLGVRVDFVDDARIGAAMRQRIDDSVRLIRTIPARAHDDLIARITELQRTTPFDEQRLAQVLRATERRSDANIRLIARDQTTKTIGKLNEVRQTGVGITHYRWSTSQDQRVRPTHQANAGQTFAWEQPPAETGHPGQDIACRCTASPLIEFYGGPLGAQPPRNFPGV